MMPINWHSIIDSRTLLVILAIGNLTSAALIITYSFMNRRHKESLHLTNFLLAKSLQAVSCLLIVGRGVIYDFWSVNIGISLLLLGFYFESMALFQMGVKKNRRMIHMVQIVTVASIIGVHLMEWFVHSPSLRVVIASGGIFLIVIIPNIVVLVNKQESMYSKGASLFYALLLLLLIPRIITALVKPGINVMTNNISHTLTYISLVLILIFSLPAYLLLIQEKANAKIRVMATTDQLTGLLNRHSFYRLSTDIIGAKRHNSMQIVLLFFDINSFKDVNDTYGHVFGDEVLRRLGAIFSTILRSEDLSCRYGADDFVVFMPDMDIPGGRKVAARIVEEISNTVFEQYSDYVCTISVGIVGGRLKDNETIEAYVARANSALNIAKGTGKNLVVDFAGG